ncbi:helix-hairpin-helix domain-containing protein [Jeotgalibacillus aurantiacus]|uniref:helix-hairpin-helix domain-containing protein n=1 Tax=Jeotgalibacillus aurantiacus TaxID=2763266 RepID=UPI001D09E794|nr:helix-hairpin-helix domain-containing protein [Jeotgalibacillus aurantiacus]
MKNWILTYRKQLLYTSPFILIILFILFINPSDQEPVPSPLTTQTMEQKPDPVTEQVETDTATESVTNEIHVDVKGQIKHPGVYRMKEGDRVIDLIAAAGGETASADMITVNLAQKLSDEMVIYIPVPGEQEFNIPDTVEKEQGKVNLNTADQAELETIPGVGPAKALAIIEFRESNGAFKEIEEIMNISGIGEKTFDKLKESITVK